MDFDAGKHELNHKGCCREARSNPAAEFHGHALGYLQEAEGGTTARGAGSAYEATLSRREDA
jgi:hypothetical protein